MENSKVQDKMLALGKAIVKELELDSRVDTLTKWMAHYLAEKIVIAESLDIDKKAEVEKLCFETILKLWEHRWIIPHNKPFLQDFESLFKTLDKLNPNKEVTFFLPPQLIFEMEEEIKLSATKEIHNESDGAQEENVNSQSLFDSAIRVDKLARYLIADLLNQAVANIKLSAEREDLIRNSIEAIDYPEIQIIRITSDSSIYQKIQKNESEETQNRISEVRSKIDKLDELTSIVQSYASRYREEILEIEKQLNNELNS